LRLVTKASALIGLSPCCGMVTARVYPGKAGENEV
jgi:hypothetical protein